MVDGLTRSFRRDDFDSFTLGTSTSGVSSLVVTEVDEVFFSPLLVVLATLPPCTIIHEPDC